MPGGPTTGGLELVCGPSREEQFVGSAFLANLNAGGRHYPGVSYTVIETRYDEVLTLYTSAFLPGPDARDTETAAAVPARLTAST